MWWALTVIFLVSRTLARQEVLSKEFSELVCEHKGKRIGCPIREGEGTFDTFINITYAMYGKLEVNACPGNSRRTNCRAASSFHAVAKNCNERQSCFIEAANSVFGDPCYGVLKYLEVRWRCVTDAVFKTIKGSKYIIFSDLTSKVGAAKVNLNPDFVNSVKGRLSFAIYSVKEVKTRLDLDTINETMVINTLKAPPIKLPDQEACLPSTGSSQMVEKYFCIYEYSGVVGISERYFKPALHVKKQFIIKLLVKTSTRNTTSYKTNLTLSVLPRCYPHSKYYTSTATSCPSAVKRYEHSESFQPKTDYLVFDIPGPIMFSSLYINLTLTDVATTKGQVCDATIRFNYGTKYQSRKVEYHVTPQTIRGFSDKVRVAGQEFNITLKPPIKMSYYRGQKTYVRIVYNCTRGSPNLLRYQTSKAMVLYAVPMITKCPDDGCMGTFLKWHDLYLSLMRVGKIQCLRDDQQQLSYIAPCLDILHLVAPFQFPFGKKIVFKCEGGYRNKEKKRWFHNDIQLPTTGYELILSGDVFNQMGKYYCSTGQGRKSYSSTVIFQDVIASTISLNVINKKYSSRLDTLEDPETHGILKSLEKEIKRVLDVVWKYKQKVTFGGFRNWNTNVNALFKILTHVPKSEDDAKYFSKVLLTLQDSARRNKFGTLQVPENTVKVRNFVDCLNETTGDVIKKGLYHWPRTAAGKTINLPCPSGPKRVQVRRGCILNEKFGASWTSYRDDDCMFVSNTTNELNSLSKEPITNSSAEGVAKKLEKLSKDQTVLTSYDTKLIGDTVSNLVNSNVTTDEVVASILETTSNVMSANESSLKDSQKKDQTLSKIVKDITKLASKIEIRATPNTPVVKVSSKIAIQAVRVDDSQKNDIQISVKGKVSESFKKSDILYGTESSPENAAVSLRLPNSVFKDTNIKGLKTKRVNFVVYKDDKLFQASDQPNDTTSKDIKFAAVNSMVLSASIFGADRVNLSSPLESSFRHKNETSKPGICVFWDFNAADGLGAWSSKGCRSVSFKSGSTICQCDHLTNFAVLFDPYAGKKSVNKKHEKILGWITNIGIGLSLLGLSLTIITMTLFRRLRRTLPSKILIQLSVALLLTLITFLVGVEWTYSVPACKTSAALIHYFLLVAFLWMLVEAVNLYLRFVKVLGSHISKFMLKAGVLCWGIPAAIIAFTLPLRWDDYGPGDFCIITGYAAYGTVFVPIILILIVNLVIFGLVMKAITASNSKLTKDKKLDGRSHLRISFMCCTLVGLTWIFGALAVADARIVFQYLFCIFNSLQGFFIFYFHVLRQAEIRKHWINFITGKGTKYTSSSSTLKKGSSSKRDTGATLKTNVKDSDQQSNTPITPEKKPPMEFNNEIYGRTVYTSKL